MKRCSLPGCPCRDEEHRYLTRSERKALILAKRKGGAQVRPPFSPVGRKEIAGHIALALVERDLLRVGKTGIANTTSLGRVELDRPVPEQPVYLRDRDGLTHRRDRAAAGEPEVVGTASLDAFWAEESVRQQAPALDARKAARKLADRTRGRAARS